MEIKKYRKDSDYSYALGAFPCFELLDARPSEVLEFILDEGFTDREKLESMCRKVSRTGEKAGSVAHVPYNIPVTVSPKTISRLSDKENVYAIGVFRKYDMKLDASRPHIVLVNPSNMGNLGTIIRTACGFGIEDIAIIGNSADHFNPKVVRASMGAIFRVRIECFDDYTQYSSRFCDLAPLSAGDKREIFCFMLNGRKQLTVADCPKPALYSLVFGNEATGLPDEYLSYGTSIIIPQTGAVDSLNLTIAAGIGMYMFTQGGF